MYCPKCSSPATESQRFCRQCGTNLGVILDAMDGKRNPVDFEKLKGDLKELGTSLRAGFEQAHEEIKKNHKVNWREQRNQFRHKNRHLANTLKDVVTETKAALPSPPEIKNLIESKRNSWYKTSREYHFQQAILKILSGGALSGVWYYLLNAAANSGFLQGIEKIILQNQPDLIGAIPVIQMLWVLGLVPVAQGIGHLVAGSFAPDIEKLLTTQMPSVTAVPAPLPTLNTPHITSEIPHNFVGNYSVTEEETVPLIHPERQAN